MLRRSVIKMLDFMGLRGPVKRLRTFRKARGLSEWEPLVPEAEFLECMCKTLCTVKSVSGDSPLGDYLEFGVSRGTSIALVWRALHRAQMLDRVRLFGFDSFQGMPPEASGQGWVPGEFHSTLSATRRYLTERSVDLDKVHLIKGWFQDTLTEQTRAEYGIDKASLIMVDCDIYSASKEALAFCEPHIHNCTAIVFDDWGWRENRGERGQKEAFQEFLKANPTLSAEPLPSYRQEARVFLVSRSRDALRRFGARCAVLLGTHCEFEVLVPVML
jgi:O-methyltransferase